MFCSFGRFFLEKNTVFCLFWLLWCIFPRENRLFSFGWMSSLFAPNKNASFFAFCGSPSYVFSPKNLLSAHVPRGSQKAPRNFAEGAQKVSRKHPEKFPESSHKASRTLPEGSQTLPQSSQKVPKSPPDDSTTLPEWRPKGSKNLPEAPRRSQKAPRKIPKKVQEAPGDINFAAFLHTASPGLILQWAKTAILGCNIGTARAGLCDSTRINKKDP